MMAALDWIIDRAPETAKLIIEIFCDSKAGSYEVKSCHDNGPCSVTESAAVAHSFSHALIELAGGHGDIGVDAVEHRFEVGALWPDEDPF